MSLETGKMRVKVNPVVPHQQPAQAIGVGVAQRADKQVFVEQCGNNLRERGFLASDGLQRLDALRLQQCVQRLEFGGTATW